MRHRTNESSFLSAVSLNFKAVECLAFNGSLMASRVRGGSGRVRAHFPELLEMLLTSLNRSQPGPCSHFHTQGREAPARGHASAKLLSNLLVGKWAAWTRLHQMLYQKSAILQLIPHGKKMEVNLDIIDREPFFISNITFLYSFSLSTIPF